MNKKGFTIVELIVSFSLAITIGFFLFKITIIIKDLYTDSYIKTNIISKQNVMTERMYDDFLYNDVKVALKCGKNCIRFIFSDNSEKLFLIEKDTFRWGDFTLKLTDGSIYNDVKVNNRKDLANDEFNNSLLSIKIPIINPSLKDETFMTNIVVPYNSNNVHMDDLKFDDENYEYYLALKEPGASFLDTESIFTDPGTYVYYGKNTCTMKTDIDYKNLKENPKEITSTFEGEGCSNLSVKIDYSTLKKDKTNYKEGEYDIPYKLYIDNEYKTTVKRHIIAFKKENRFSYKGTINNNQSIYEYTFPMSGYYSLELWGASGLGSESGYGAYSRMTVRFLKGEKVYVYVGQMNNSITGRPNFNTNSTLSFNGFSGGGATDIRLNANENSRILIAGGGGSGLYSVGGYGTNNGSSYGDSKANDKSATTCAPGGGYNTFDVVSCTDKASGGTSYIKDKVTINGREAQIIKDNTKYNPLIIEGNKKMKNPYTGNEANHGNDGDGYAIITFIGDKID